jgi:3-hydroxyisobutyrate dehydrogenase-like beta-hydroxyacid dehydrogenase
MRASFGNILYTGPLGTALIPKIYSNMLCCVHLLAAAEVLMVGEY